jgi:predicted small lipoprotein YifL
LALVKTIRTAVAAAALVAALAGCGSPVAGTPAAQPAPPTTPAPTTQPPSPAADRRAIEGVFHDYYRALLARDFTTACGYNAPETTSRLLAELHTRGVDANTCEEGMTAVYAIPENAEVVEQVGKNATIDGVTVNDDEAVIKWTSKVNGKAGPGTTHLRRVDGRWLLSGGGTGPAAGAASGT